MIDLVAVLSLVLLAAVVVNYEVHVDYYVKDRNRWREKCWRYELFEVPEMRSALLAKQDQIEELQDEIDDLRVGRVLPESVGNGGRC